ncbi:NrfD/PsrC family molybdoenzyme membrane anchor subunit [Escherichia coli]
MALGGGFWTWWFWLGVAGLGLIVPMLLKPWVNRSSGIPAVLAACGASLVGVLMLRFFHSLRRAVNGGVSQKEGGLLGRIPS